MIIKDFEDDNAKKGQPMGQGKDTEPFHPCFLRAAGCPDCMCCSARPWTGECWLLGLKGKEAWWEMLGKCVNIAWSQIPCPSTWNQFSQSSEEEHDKLDGWLFSVPPRGTRIPIRAPSSPPVVGKQDLGECPSGQSFYAHLRQRHTRWHTHPISFSFDFESMKIVQRMLIFRKEGMEENNESSLLSQCWQIAAIPWFPARNAELSPHMNILSIIQRESLPLGCLAWALFLPTGGFLRLTGHRLKQPEATCALDLFEG